MRRAHQPRNTGIMRRLRWVGGGLALLLLIMFMRRGGPAVDNRPPPTVAPYIEQQILSEASLAAECSDWDYVSLSPSRDVKLLSAQFFLPYNLSFVLIGPRADRSSLWAPQNVRSTCTVRPKAHGMQAYAVFCPLNTTEDKYRADARGEMQINVQVDDVMFKKISVCKDGAAVSRKTEAAVCALVTANDLPWLEQWLEYHSMMGIDTFYLYEALESGRGPSRSFVTASSRVGEAVQWRYFTYHPTVMKTAPERARVAAYNDCWMRYRGSASWLGFLQLQDFVYSPQGVANITEILQEHKEKNVAEITVWPMQENDKEKLSDDHIRDSAKLSNRLMLEKYQYRRDYPAGGRSFVRPEAIFFMGDSKLMEADPKVVSSVKTDLEILSFNAERDGFDSVDPHRWKAFPKPAQQLAEKLTKRLKSRSR